MALLEEQFTEKLDAGASPITYEGNEGREQQIAQALWDKLPPQARMQFGSFAQFFSSGAWKKVLAALQQQMQQGPEEIQETETETIGRAPQEGLGALMPQPRPMAFGGVAGDDGRRAYGLGSIFKSVTKPIKKIVSKVKDFGKKLIGGVKKVVKSPIGKAALLGAGIYGLGGGSFFGRQLPGLAKSGGFGLGNLKPNVMKYLVGTAAQQAPNIAGPIAGLAGRGIPTGFSGATSGLLGAAGKFSPWKSGAALAALPFGMQAMGKWDPGMDQFTREGGQFDFDYDQMRQEIAEAVSGGDYENFKAVLAKYGATEGVQVGFWDTLAHGAEGGRAMAQGGRIGLRHGSDRGPLYIDENYDLDIPLTNYEKELRELSKEEREEELRILKLVLRQRGNIGRDLAIPGGGKTGKERQMELLNWGTDRPDKETGYKGDYSMRHRAAEYLDRPYFDEHYETGEHYNKGGRIRAQEGGLMDLGGMEKDYREDGGFVPIGGEEKADDVPARLSKNEFVFTADAVRAAGGGDIDQGAEVMENVMKNLERGGEISEESQGQGARDMFQVSERLSEVV
jgi:hypothetical protein